LAIARAGREVRGEGLARLFYRLAYRAGSPRWDRDEPRPELVALVAGRSPGRALDLGCGTGSDALYLAQHGWQVVGVDFAPEAIATAQDRTHDDPALSPVFVVGDVTKLRESGVKGPFDLVIDIGCYHGIPTSRRDAYAIEVAAVAAPGADFFLAGIADPPVSWRLVGAKGLDRADIDRRFGPAFDVVEARASDGAGTFSQFWLYHLVRKA